MPSQATKPKAIIRSHVYPEIGMGWRGSPELPMSGEIMKETGDMPKENHIDAIYAGKDAYLEVHYKLLRHEGTEPLRRAVQEYRHAPDMLETTETCVYTKMFVRGVNIIRLGVMVRVTFSAMRTRQLIDWPTSQRLVPGTVVALSPVPDNFKTQCIVAVVTGRYDGAIDSPEIPPPLDLEIPSPQISAAMIDPDQEYVMIEARSSYYEAVRHVMEGLKQASKEESLLDKYLVKGTNAVGRSGFFSPSSSSLDIPSICSGAYRHSVPTHMPLRDSPECIQSKARLDKSQALAFHRMITKELAIIQGPPGTGKTHTSMEALKVLLGMQPDDIPVILAAQKNDTVDELLIRCHKLGVSFVRLGGQAKDAIVSRKTLFSLRMQSRGKAWQNDQLQKRLDFLKSQATTLLSRCYPPFRQQLIRLEHLEEAALLTAEQSASIMTDGNRSTIQVTEASVHPFRLWLGDQVVALEPHSSIHVPLDYTTARTEIVDDFEYSEGNTTKTKKEQLTGKPIVFSRWLGIRSSTPPNSGWEDQAKELLQHQNLWDIPIGHRGMVYQHLEQRYIASTKLALSTVFKQINEVTKELKVARWREDVDTVRRTGARIVGCTTTGLTKYRGLLAALQPQIMMIEEAAETREANIMAALFPSLRQMILVGDHMQLAPHTDVLELSKPPFNLNVSLFQRLVERGLEHSSLQVQRRMAPAIRKLLNPWYPLLVDHACVRRQGLVPGMRSQRLLWFDHRRPESTDRYSSKVNVFEAEMILGLYGHLVQNGTKPSEITILNFYSGQKTYIEKILRQRYTICGLFLGANNGPTIQTVDGYQGKENGIVLVSVTRSPEDRGTPDAGFLKDSRRVIVALSRSRRLLAIFGDAQNLLESPARPIWSKVLDMMEGLRAGHISVFCQAHQREIRVQQPDEWERLAGNGGCDMRCGRRTDIGGARCGRKCHGGPCGTPTSDTVTDRCSTSSVQTFSELSTDEDLIDLKDL